MLTDVAIRNAKPRDKRFKVFDGKGLYLEVYPEGGRYWRLKYRIAGKEKRLAMGVYPEIKIARELVRQGLDPQIEKKIAKAKNLEEGQHTFESMAKEWLSKHASGWTGSYSEKIGSVLHANLYPRLGSIPIARVTAAMLVEAVRLPMCWPRTYSNRAKPKAIRISRLRRSAIFCASYTIIPAGPKPESRCSCSC